MSLIQTLYFTMTSTQSPQSNKKPNVLLVVMDDMGYSDLGCFGGEIDTPNIDALANQGLRFTQFYNTGRCWPTRSCTLTGYYAPQVCMDPPLRDYRARWQRMIPEFLKSANYRSYHSGKWHIFNTPKPEVDSGFDISFGYDIEQDKHHFEFNGVKKFSSTGITDHAIDCLKDHQANHSDKPFFHYLAYIAPHFPVQAEQADIDKYMGVYDEGWDVMRTKRWQRLKDMGIVNCDLSEREPDVPAPHYLEHKDEWGALLGPGEVEYALPWNDLTDEQKEFQATKMAIHAAMVDRTDKELGRLLKQIKDMGAQEDTIVFFISDNGASAEMLVRGEGHDPEAAPGSEASYLCLGPGWSSNCNAPFRRHKIWVHEGGVSTPLVVSWPKGIKTKGELRHDRGHVIDFLPTLLDLAGVDANDIEREGAPPLPGRSLVPAFDQEGAIERDHIFFHHQGNRALISGNYKLVNESIEQKGRLDDEWALYDLRVDRSEMNDLSKDQPELLAKLMKLWQGFEDEYRNQEGYQKK
jgi:arylsulfatase A-like enzyme